MATISGPISTFHPRGRSTTPYEYFKRDPTRFIAKYIYSLRPKLPLAPTPRDQPAVTVVCISDTHNTPPIIPKGDILLHAGDLTEKGTFAELQNQLNWLNTLPHTHKIVIAGNHDLLLDVAFVDQFPYRIAENLGATRADLNWGGITYLEDSSTAVTVRGRKITIHGSPMTPQFGTWAFQYPPIRDIWKDKLPAHLDILLTHGPPRGHLDQEGKGCEWLARELWLKRPSLVVFGHIHGGNGIETLCWDYVEQVYNGVNVGEKGLMSVFAMAVVLTLQKLWSWAFGWKGTASTTLVNAAVACGENSESRPAVVIEM